VQRKIIQMEMWVQITQAASAHVIFSYGSEWVGVCSAAQKASAASDCSRSTIKHFSYRDTRCTRVDAAQANKRGARRNMQCIERGAGLRGRDALHEASVDVPHIQIARRRQINNHVVVWKARNT
jgi:hypothetical protein